MFPVSGSLKGFRLKTGVYTDVVIQWSDPMLRTATLKTAQSQSLKPQSRTVDDINPA